MGGGGESCEESPGGVATTCHTHHNNWEQRNLLKSDKSENVSGESKV